MSTKVDISELIKQSLIQESAEAVDQEKTISEGSLDVNPGMKDIPSMAGTVWDKLAAKLGKTVAEAKTWASENPELATKYGIGAGVVAGAGALGAGALALKRRRSNK